MSHRPLVIADRKAIACWLFACLLLVALMVVVGGYTRLSGSGLSITAWKPVHGAIPPLSENAWEEEFAAYRQSPQYLKVNTGMTLEEFKAIYWPEYLHRLLGRAIGFVVLVPLLIFAARKSLTRAFAWRLLGIFLLGGLQGAIGWYMVKSGLANDPHVSHFRLALHLSVAFAIFGLLLWTFLDVILSAAKDPLAVGDPSPSAQDDMVVYKYIFWFSLLCLQIVFGALVAGLHAGLIYNTWPTMNGEWLPEGLLTNPISENLTLIQFIHRWLAVAVAAGFLGWWYAHRHAVNTRLCTAVTAIIAAQFLLGVLTLIHVVPLPLALMHQWTALLLFAAAMALMYKISQS